MDVHNIIVNIKTIYFMSNNETIYNDLNLIYSKQAFWLDISFKLQSTSIYRIRLPCEPAHSYF